MKEKKHELKKHAATIHCANTLTLLQRKISNALLYHAYHELMEKDEHEITMKQLCKIIDYHGHNYEAIKNSLRGLITTLIEWNVVDEESNMEDWTASTILASVRIKGPYCTYAYSPRMKQLLYSPKIYGKINLIIQSKFQSSYGLALYENCIRYKGLPQTKWFDLTLFRKLMGVPDSKYLIFRDLKRRVIDKSVNEINTYSDLSIEVEFAKAARQVNKIRFKLKEKEKKKILGENILAEKTKKDIYQKLIELGMTQSQADKVFTEYNEEYILEKIQMIKTSENFTTIKNFPGYLLSALKKDFKNSKLTSLDLLNIKSDKKDNYLTVKNNAIEKNKEIYDQYISFFIDKKLKLLTQVELNVLNTSFEQYLRQDNEFFWEKYCKNGLKSEMVKKYYWNYIRKNCPEYVSDILSYEEFLESENFTFQEQ